MSLRWSDTCTVRTQDANKNKTWIKEYWDNHPRLPIFKIDSHQLDEDGQNIKRKKRYSKLIPNLFLLSCNFFADKAAEIAHTETFTTIHKPYTDTIKIPSSSLRFIFTWNGTGIDKHISTWLTFIFQEERIKQLRKKATQGLPWRVIQNQWSKIMSKRELFNSLKGFSRTHTRSLYKSTIYREGWIKETLTRSNDFIYSQQREYGTKEWTDYLSKCLWCENRCKSKGNRTHAIHFCQHKLLKNFRVNITNLLEERILDLLQCIKETQNADAADSFIQSIEKILLQLHGIQDREQHKFQDIYRTRSMWTTKNTLLSSDVYQYRRIPMYANIFGFVPIMETEKISDTNLNAATSISLGIIPKILDREITHLGNNLSKVESDAERTNTVRANYRKIWNEIKEINETKVMGLHKIIGVVSKEYESEFRTKHNIDERSWRALKKSLKDASDKDRPKKLNKHHTGTRQRIIEERKKFCTGTTCNRMYTTWNFDLKPNLIKFNLKHCQRCAKQQTALKKGAQIIDHCINQSSQTQNEDLIHHLDKTSSTINYNGIMKYIHIDKTSRGPSISKKRKITDAQKGNLKTISTCITKLTNCNNPPDKRLKIAKKILQDTPITSNKFLKDDLKHNIDINTVLFNTKSCDQKPIIKKESNVIDLNETSTFNTEEIQIRGDIASALVSNQWMFSYSLDRAIRNIRMQAPANIFIANTSISTTLKTWKPTHGWDIIATHFRSISVMNHKPHGTYIIPIFSGIVTGGHWSLAVIWKQSKTCKGWILDSMGKGNTSSDIAKATKKAFGRARMQCRWQDIECRKQKEVECGPRTIVVMVSICKNLRNGISIENAITKASLMHISDSSYAPEKIRRTAASWMRMTEATLERWKTKEEDLRTFYKNRKHKRNRRQSNQTMTEIITIE